MMQRSKTKSTKSVKHERNGFNRASGSERRSPHPCRESNERVFFRSVFVCMELDGLQIFSELVLAVFARGSGLAFSIFFLITSVEGQQKGSIHGSLNAS